eukprot:Em0005g767a
MLLPLPRHAADLGDPSGDLLIAATVLGSLTVAGCIVCCACIYAIMHTLHQRTGTHLASRPVHYRNNSQQQAVVTTTTTTAPVITETITTRPREPNVPTTRRPSFKPVDSQLKQAPPPTYHDALKCNEAPPVPPPQYNAPPPQYNAPPPEHSE